MSAQLESGGDRYYAAVRLAELRKEIPKLITGMHRKQRDAYL